MKGLLLGDAVPGTGTPFASRKRYGQGVRRPSTRRKIFAWRPRAAECPATFPARPCDAVMRRDLDLLPFVLAACRRTFVLVAWRVLRR
jgi:hypothetical protein